MTAIKWLNLGAALVLAACATPERSVQRQVAPPPAAATEPVAVIYFKPDAYKVEPSYRPMLAPGAFPMPDTVHVYLFDGYADWEPAFAMAGIQNPQHQREPGRWQVRTVGPHAGHAVRSMGGVAAVPDLALDMLEPADSALLILPGGEGWEDSDRHAAAVAKAAACLSRGVAVAAICGATAGLARAGLLDARPHTSNAAAYLKGTGYAGAEHYVDAPVVNADGLITAGGMAPIEFAREIFAALTLYEDEALEAWFQLYKTGKSAYYARMERAADAAGAG